MKHLFFQKYFVERLHNLIVDFICKMTNKIKDLRNKNEEFIKLTTRDETLSMGGSIAHHYYSQFATTPQFSQAAINYSHGFEDLLNLVHINYYLKN